VLWHSVLQFLVVVLENYLIYIYIYIPKGGGRRIYLKIESGVGGVDREVVSIDEHGDVHT
jgi:hypothetical protein